MKNSQNGWRFKEVGITFQGKASKVVYVNGWKYEKHVCYNFSRKTCVVIVQCIQRFGKLCKTLSRKLLLMDKNLGKLAPLLLGRHFKGELFQLLWGNGVLHKNPLFNYFGFNYVTFIHHSIFKIIQICIIFIHCQNFQKF